MTLELQAAGQFDDATSVATFYWDNLQPVSPGIDVDAEALRRLQFTGKTGEVQRIDVQGRPVIVVGMGKQGEATADTYRRAAGAAVRAAKKSESLALLLDVQSQAVAEGVVLGSYVFTAYKSSPEPTSLARVTVVGADAEALAAGEHIAKAVNIARDMINEPPSAMTPRAVARVAGEVAHAHGFGIEIWDFDRIVDEQLGGILGVAKGSDEPPRLIKLSYEPDNAGDDTKTIALVGKGITFDSGGLSIKPADGMMEMKTDMAGAAAVLAAMAAIAGQRPNVRVRGYLAVAENMPGPAATKPGDILTARNGKTMEVLNTDAEGRLVLADALSLAVEDGADVIVDIATLTGACKIALGNEVAGLFGNDENAVEQAKSAAAATAEPVWHMPLHDGYRKLIDSPVADIKNMASPGGGGLITSAFFLREFVDGKPWLHLDVAGPARGDGDAALNVRGATGFGVRLLTEFVCSYR